MKCANTLSKGGSKNTYSRPKRHFPNESQTKVVAIRL